MSQIHNFNESFDSYLKLSLSRHNSSMQQDNQNQRFIQNDQQQGNQSINKEVPKKQQLDSENDENFGQFDDNLKFNIYEQYEDIISDANVIENQQPHIEQKRLVPQYTNTTH